MITRIYFVRHAQPDFSHAHDMTRPLTPEGMADAAIVLKTLKNADIDAVYSSPYKRSVDTVRETAAFFNTEIRTDERLRERGKGENGNNHGMFRLRWADHSFHEDGGESIEMVQRRNIEALREILDSCRGKNVVIGTHGTALSSIMNYYMPEFGFDDFMRIIDWMPYVVEMDFDGQRFVSLTEHVHIEKVFTGKNRADKK